MAFNFLMSPTKVHSMEYSALTFLKDSTDTKKSEKKSKEEKENSKETRDIA